MNDRQDGGKPACRHRYSGSHEDGWTCVNCGNWQEWVSYRDTSDYIKSRARLEASEKALEAAIGKMAYDAFEDGRKLGRKEAADEA